MASPAPLNHESSQSSHLIIEYNGVHQELKSMLFQINFLQENLVYGIMSSPVTVIYGDEALLSWRWLNTCLLMGITE